MQQKSERLYRCGGVVAATAAMSLCRLYRLGKRAPRVVSLGLAFIIIIGAMWLAYRHTQLTHPTPEFLNTAD
ncbi:MAG: hypothetical protein ACU84Q_11845, partial [Gammaproteobacteria bacterium]